jgi:hypothetical protein
MLARRFLAWACAAAVLGAFPADADVSCPTDDAIVAAYDSCKQRPIPVAAKHTNDQDNRIFTLLLSRKRRIPDQTFEQGREYARRRRMVHRPKPPN